MNATGGGARRVASKRDEEDERGPGNGERSATCEMLDQSWIASIVLPNVPPVSDTSNLARSTIRRVILVNESLSAAWIPR